MNLEMAYSTRVLGSLDTVFFQTSPHLVGESVFFMQSTLQKC